MTKSKKKKIYKHYQMGHLSLEKQLNTPINLLAIYYAVFRPPIVKYIYEYHGLDNYAKPEQRDLIS